MNQPPSIDLKNATLYVRDAGTNYLEVRIGEGNLTYSSHRNIEFIKSRGELDRVNEGEEEPCSVAFQFIWEHITTHSGEVIALEDALRGTGGASSWESTAMTDPGAPYCPDLVLVYSRNCPSTAYAETLYFSQFHVEDLAHDLRAGTVDCTGKANVPFPIAS